MKSCRADQCCAEWMLTTSFTQTGLSVIWSTTSSLAKMIEAEPSVIGHMCSWRMGAVSIGDCITCSTLRRSRRWAKGFRAAFSEALTRAMATASSGQPESLA
ncbi:hypothetical protein D3C86_1897120 [compost metagenome]